MIVLDGDGSLLMQLGSLATVAGAAPANYTHVLFANGVYQTSGSQAIPGAGAVDFVGMAEAAGTRSRRASTRWRSFASGCPSCSTHGGRCWWSWPSKRQSSRP